MEIKQDKWINPKYIVSVEYIEDIQQTIINTLDGKSHNFVGEDAKYTYDYYAEKRFKPKTFTE